MVLPAISGCATSHQYCSKHLDEYLDYDQCYADREAIRDRRQFALSHMGDGLANQKTINCHSYANGNNVQTTCD